jgi:hypothetical protein
MNKIFLSRNKKTIVDEDDFNWLNQWKWSYDGRYATRSEWQKGKNISKKIYMHQLIMGLEKISPTDHINRNKLDNRKINLRLCSNAENIRNRGLTKKNKSGVTGVCWHTKAKKWMAQIMKDRKYIYLGLFSHIELAIKTRKDAELKYWGYNLSI